MLRTTYTGKTNTSATVALHLTETQLAERQAPQRLLIEFDGNITE